ncbi:MULTISPECIES: carbohydrate ABC transporter permease [Streptomyces]|uniref:Carbohydrate ABC transporter permease n=1 Tax=Streptomyces lycii TaxID=2654337 RepID=A0ABQ7FIF2_9ACTN|nr:MULTISPECIES: carbohydrate ABC transporter permease [Streptomyces]KAF4408702.1 carbohydrate ABC transporter permease [Streptomyces lycii]PGH46759.1 sugar ABC transporter permease [Streptomyces sp. Ru87]
MASETTTLAAGRARGAATGRKGPGSRGRLGLTLFTAVLAAGAFFPVLWMISAALKPRDQVNDGKLIPDDVTLQNFVYVFTEVPFARYLWNSFFVSAVITLVALLLHSMAAYALARLRFPGRETVFTLIFSTLLITAPVVLIPLFLVARELGLLDSYAGLIIPAIFNAFGIFLLRQFYLGIPRELEEAAIVDGCGHWRVYWSIVLPLSRPILSALAIFFFLANWNAFLWPLVATNNPDLTVVQLAITTFQTQYTSAWNYILAAALVAAAPMLVLFFAFQRQIVESIKTSGLK